ncbi:hypothetical protein CFD26_105021 [Aspergillus turcosus]|uniref:Condensation domain-containing protein n=1 Tax=Aspergillus turcosus TaxID=1245748 RepID=A0A3R7IKB0_9EURO|nr:hypothetical protein CFD26_105021 [Aspergillus turcosus]
MADVHQLEKLRSLGKLEQVSASCHHLGFFNNVGVSVQYKRSESSSPAVTDLRGLIQAAAGYVVRKRRILFAIPVNEGAPDLYFASLPSIDLNRTITFLDRSQPVACDAEGQDKELDAILEDQHNTDFKAEYGTLPFWRLIILQSPGGTEFTASFIYHHAIGDGLSGLALHHAFRNALEAAPASSLPGYKVENIIVPDENTSVLPPLEGLHPLPINPTPSHPPTSIIATLPREVVDNAIGTYFDATRVQFTRTDQTPPDSNVVDVLSGAQHISNSINDYLGNVSPSGEPYTSVAVFKTIPDVSVVFNSMLGKPRDAAFEVTNVGLFSPATTPQTAEDARWQVGDVLLSRSSAVPGAAVTGGNGNMALGFSWQEGVVEDGFMDNVRQGLATTAICLMARDRESPSIPVKAQMLLSPMLDDRCESVSDSQFEYGSPRCGVSNRTAWEHVLGEERGVIGLRATRRRGEQRIWVICHRRILMWGSVSIPGSGGVVRYEVVVGGSTCEMHVGLGRCIGLMGG